MHEALGLWTWLINIYAPAMYTSHWYNGDKDSNEMYISDKSSVLIGMPRIRQLRIVRGKRGVKYYFSTAPRYFPLLICQSSQLFQGQRVTVLVLFVFF